MSYYIPSFICMICISVQIGRSSVRACIWTGPIGPEDTDGPDRTNSIGSIRLGLKSVGPGRYRSGPDRGCPYLLARGISVYEIMMYKNHLSRKYQKELVLFEDAGAMVDRGGGGQT